MEDVFNIIQWAFISVVSPAVVWLFQKQVRTARSRKEIHDTYEQMYNSVSKSIIELLNENQKMFETLRRLEQAISETNRCLYSDNCPVVRRLQKHKPNGGPRDGRKPPADRQREHSDGANDKDGTGSGVAIDTDAGG